MNIAETKEGIIIDIYVKPNAPKFEIIIEDKEILVKCTEEPTKSKVNKELIKEFTKLFHTKVTIISGTTSKQKRLCIKNLDKKTVDQILKTK